MMNDDNVDQFQEARGGAGGMQNDKNSTRRQAAPQINTRQRVG